MTLNDLECPIQLKVRMSHGLQGWGPRGLASTSRTARGQNFAAMALALASKTPGLGLGLGLDNARVLDFEICW